MQGVHGFPFAIVKTWNKCVKINAQKYAEFNNSDIQLFDGSSQIQPSPKQMSVKDPDEDDDENGVATRNEQASSQPEKYSGKPKQGGKGRRPRWKKRRPSNPNNK